MKQEVYLNSTEFQPKDELVLVKPIDLKPEKATESGIVFDLGKQRSVTERPSHGVVISKGANVEDVDVGSTVVWPAQDGIDLKFLDGEFLVLRHKSIIGAKKQDE